MSPLRRELLNGLLVLVVASLLSVAFSAFQVSFKCSALGVDLDGHSHRGRWLHPV